MPALHGLSSHEVLLPILQLPLNLLLCQSYQWRSCWPTVVLLPLLQCVICDDFCLNSFAVSASISCIFDWGGSSELVLVIKLEAITADILCWFSYLEIAMLVLPIGAVRAPSWSLSLLSIAYTGGLLGRTFVGCGCLLHSVQGKTLRSSS
jgi:hypothetical protein